MNLSRTYISLAKSVGAETIQLNFKLSCSHLRPLSSMTPMKDVFIKVCGVFKQFVAGKQYPDAGVMVNTLIGVGPSTGLVGSNSTGRSRFESWVSGFIFLFADLRLSLKM